MRTQICIMTWADYYKEKVIYEDIFSVCVRVCVRVRVRACVRVRVRAVPEEHFISHLCLYRIGRINAGHQLNLKSIC